MRNDKANNIIRQLYNDMMIGIMPHCKLFIGTRASTFAAIVSMFRIAISRNSTDDNCTSIF